MFSAQDLNNAIEQHRTLFWEKPNKWNNLTEEGWADFDERLWYEVDYGKYAVVIDGDLYGIKSVYHDGGGEGHGEYIESIIEVDGRLFRKTGYYMSYDGSTWDGDLEEVEAYEKTVIDYRPVSR